MKAVIVLILAFATAMFAQPQSASEHQQPKGGNPPVTHEALSSVVFPTPQSGWIVGANGTILHTEDSGKTWKTQASGASGTDATLRTVVFVTPQLGWIVGDYGTILHTEDGQTWKKQTSGTRVSLYSIAFVTPKSGWAVGESTAIHTEDGGQTWTTQTISIPNGIYSVAFATPQLGWAVGPGGINMAHTEDGGQNWTQITAGVPNGLFRTDSGPYLNSMVFVTPQAGWAVGFAGTILHTEDGGKTWKEQNSGAPDDEFTSVAFVTPQSGWAVGNGAIVHTEDGGQTWKKQTKRSLDVYLRSVAFATPQSGWAVGIDGLIMHTEDAGQTWAKVSESPEEAGMAEAAKDAIEVLHSVAFVTPQSGWAVGSPVVSDGVILHTADGGKTWKKQTSGTESSLYSIAFTTSQSGWVVGEHGVILHTEDSGETWKPQSSGTDVALHSVGFLTPKWGWAVGERGVLLQTDDGGQTWKMQSSKDWLDSVAFTTQQSGWAVSSTVDRQGSTILHTEDGGRTWQRQIVDSRSSLHFVSFVTPQSGWAGGSDGVILHTEDAGKTWKAQTTGSTQGFNSVTFVTPQLGWASGTGGDILHTENGGKKWKKQNSGTEAWLPSVTFATPQSGWAVGEDGLILHTEDGGRTWVKQAGPGEQPPPPASETGKTGNPSSPAPGPKEKTGQIKAGKQYTSAKGTFSITVPPGNWAVDTYKFKASQLKQDNYDYEEIIFYIPDFGQAYSAGVHRIPQAALAEMAKEQEKQTLSNMANKALHLWRSGYAEEPQPVEENSVQTQFGGGLLRIYLAKRSSMIVKMVGGKGEPIDTHIAVLVVKKGNLFIYAAVEDDDLQTQSPGQSSADPKPILSKNLQSFFASMTVTDLKESSSLPEPGFATGPTQPQLRKAFLAVVAQSLPAKTSQPATLGWRINFGESGSNPVMADGILFVGSADGAVYALDPKTGETKWRFQTGESLSPATSGPQIITVPRGSSVNDQINAGVIAAEEQAKKQKPEGIRRVDMTPAVENGTVFIGAGDHVFYAIDAATGKKKWSYVAGSGMACSNYTSCPKPAPVLKKGAVYLMTEEGLHALDAVTGNRKWLFRSPEEMNNGTARIDPAGFVLGDDGVFVTATIRRGGTAWKRSIYALDPESGKQLWAAGMDDVESISAPIRAEGLVFFSGEERFLDNQDRIRQGRKATIYAIDAANGRTKWKVGTETEYGTPQLASSGNTIYFSTDKNLLALELETGRQIWSYSAKEISPSLRADGQLLYVVTHKGSDIRPKETLHALALSTGQEKWSQSLGGYISVDMIHDGVVYASGDHLHALDAATGKELWTFKDTRRETARLIGGDRIFLTSPTVSYVGTSQLDQGYLYAIDAKTGKLKP
jgi:photosystem II stability/assembly factor-like uncharacterized protein/outer membrane protein assembly factor BamB